MYILAAIFLAIVSVGLPEAWMALAVFVGAMLALGMGNGAVFQLVPQRFRREIGVMTGLVAAGELAREAERGRQGIAAGHAARAYRWQQRCAR